MKVLDKPVYRFEDVEVDVSQGSIRRAGQSVHLRQQTFQVLVYLLERRDRIVGKDELIEALWKDTAVTDNVLLQCVKDIRKALEDDPRDPRFIKTFPKAGYRFIGQVEEFQNGELAFEETEEITSVDVEFKEEITDETPQRRNAETRRALSNRRVFLFPRSRVALAALALASIAILLAIFLIVYVRQKNSQTNLRVAEVTLPQVPGKKGVAVMYFENRSSTAELDWLQEGLADMLITGLSRSRGVTVLSRQQLHILFERTGHKPTDHISLEESLDIAGRSRANVIVLGGFAKLGETIRIEAQLHDSRTGGLIAAESLTVDKPDQLLRQVDLLSLKLAHRLGAASDEDQSAKLAQVMTDNLEAYRYYSLAIEKAQAYHNTEALALLEKAVKLDPQFAMAHARIGYTYGVSWSYPEKAKPHLEKAFQLSHRLTEKYRHYISAWYSIVNQDYPAAIRSYREIVTLYPMEIEAYPHLGRMLMGENRFQEAAEALEQAVVLDGESANVHNILGLIYIQMGRHDEGIASHKRYVQLAPTEPNAYDSLGLSYHKAGRYDEAIEEYNRAIAIKPDFDIARIHLGNAYFQQGRYREALEEFYKYIEVAPGDKERRRGHGCLVSVYLKKGDLEQASRAVERLLNYPGGESWEHLALVIERGDKQSAERIMRQIFSTEHFVSRGTKDSRRIMYYHLGSMALKEGRTAEAIKNFKEALQNYAPYYNLDTYEDCMGNAYLELGRLDEAVAEYERILTINPNYPLAHYHLAESYARKGDYEQARANYERFLEVWKNADQDLPELIAARKYISSQ